MKLKRGNSCLMILKIDPKKAYDRLEWSVIHKMFELNKFLPDLIALFMNYISFPSISIFFNRGKMELFQLERGLRQGDPLSPYLFILFMDFLGALINREIENEDWEPIKT